MIRGIEGVVQADAIEVGRFYLAPSYTGAPMLFQCIESNEEVVGQSLRAVIFPIDGEGELRLSAIPTNQVVVALTEVAIRVDAPSASGTAFSSTMEAGTFLVAGEEAFLCVPNSRFGWVLVNLTKAEIVAASLQPNWISFSRWSLVMEDGGEEVAITSFGAAEE